MSGRAVLIYARTYGPGCVGVGRWLERKGSTLPYRPAGPVRLDPETLREVVEEGLDFRRDVEGRARVRRG